MSQSSKEKNEKSCMKVGLIPYNQGSNSTKMMWQSSGQEVASQQCNAVVMMAVLPRELAAG